MKHDESKLMIAEFFNYLNNREWEKLELLLAENFEAILPQTRETIKGQKNYIEILKRFPETYKIEHLNLYLEHDRWDFTDTVISEVLIQAQLPDGSEIKCFVVSIFVIETEMIISATHYWGDSGPAPTWRKNLVETY